MFYYELEVERMKCGMCEAHINNLIRKEYNNAKKVKSNHKKNLTTFKVNESIDLDKLRNYLDNLGYKVKRINVEEL